MPPEPTTHAIPLEVELLVTATRRGERGEDVELEDVYLFGERVSLRNFTEEQKDEIRALWLATEEAAERNARAMRSQP